jgi:hypothetical protein
MEIKNSEWTEFAEFIAAQSTWSISQYPDDGTYICCPFSTIERAYAAFSVWRACHSQSEVKKFYDVDYVKASPYYDPMEEYYRELEEEENEYYAYLQKQEEIEECYEQQYPDCTWQPEWDTYISDREKQITRIAHELADRHEYLKLQDLIRLVYPFYDKYELNSDERTLFVDEYHAQCYHKYGHV